MSSVRTVGECGQDIAQQLRHAEQEVDGGVPIQPTHPKIYETRAFVIVGLNQAFGITRGTAYESYYDRLGNSGMGFAQHEALNPKLIDGVECHSEQFGIGIFDKDLEVLQGMGRLSVYGKHGRFALRGDMEPIDVNPHLGVHDTRFTAITDEITQGRVMSYEELIANHAKLSSLAYFFRNPAEDHVLV